MGVMIDGQWFEGFHKTRKTGEGGRFVRQQSKFRSWVTADGSAGPTGEDGFAAEVGRYHLYVSLACPWAHRTLIFRALKRLEDAISLSVVDYFMGENGWEFSDRPGALPDTVNNAAFLYQVYTTAERTYTGRITVPVLWDKQRKTIVNNESAEIIRMFNTAFDGLGSGVGNPELDLYPEDLRGEIEAVNDRVYDTVNNGVYKCGFATTQDAYDEAIGPLFDTLDWLEARLSRQAFVAGDRLTEADWRLFTTLVRFDPVYNTHFKCNVRRLVDYPNLWAYTRQLYQMPGVAGTVNFDHIKGHYYTSHETVNPHRIVPAGPLVDFDEPHGRG